MWGQRLRGREVDWTQYRFTAREFKDEIDADTYQALVRIENERRAQVRGRVLKVLGIVLIAYALVWLGGAVSYNYTHKCVRSHVIPGDPGDRDPDTHQGGGDTTVCDWTVDNGHRWTILGPIKLFRTGALHLPGT